MALSISDKKKKCNFLLHEAKFWIANAKVFGGTKWFCSKFFALIVLNIFQRVVQKLHEYIFKKDNSVAVIICRQLEGVFALYFVPDINLCETSITTIRQRRKTLALYDFHVFYPTLTIWTKTRNTTLQLSIIISVSVFLLIRHDIDIPWS